MGEGRGEGTPRHIRLGFSYVHALGEAALKRLEEERSRGPYRSLRDFLHRTRLPREAVENLIAVGAMDCFGRPRRELLWEAGVDDRGKGLAPTTQHSALSTQHPTQSSVLPLAPLPAPSLPSITPYEETAAEYSLLGMSPGRHAVELFRDLLEEIGAVSCGRLAELPRNLVIKVGGLVVCEQAPPTAKGHVFLTLEDETGLANVVLRPQVYQRFRRVLQTNQIVLVEGLLQREDRVTNLMARKVSPLHRTALAAQAKRPHRR